MIELIHTFQIRNLFHPEVFLGSVICVIHTVFSPSESPPLPGSLFSFSHTWPLGGVSGASCMTSQREACPRSTLLPDWRAWGSNDYTSFTAVLVDDQERSGCPHSRPRSCAAAVPASARWGLLRARSCNRRGESGRECGEVHPVLRGDGTAEGTLAAAGPIPAAGGEESVTKLGVLTRARLLWASDLIEESP